MSISCRNSSVVVLHSLARYSNAIFIQSSEWDGLLFNGFVTQLCTILASIAGVPNLCVGMAKSLATSLINLAVRQLWQFETRHINLCVFRSISWNLQIYETTDNLVFYSTNTYRIDVYRTIEALAIARVHNNV